MRMTIVAAFAAAFTMSVSAQDFMAESGTPAVAFPKPHRPVADIISPILHDEKERDDAGVFGEVSTCLRFLTSFGRLVSSVTSPTSEATSSPNISAMSGLVTLQSSIASWSNAAMTRLESPPPVASAASIATSIK
jgi:hypothetical protein